MLAGGVLLLLLMFGCFVCLGCFSCSVVLLVMSMYVKFVFFGGCLTCLGCAVVCYVVRFVVCVAVVVMLGGVLLCWLGGRVVVVVGAAAVWLFCLFGLFSVLCGFVCGDYVCLCVAVLCVFRLFGL